jgi:phosphonatase-like hydrolase
MKPRLVVLDMIGTTVRSGDEVPAAFREAMASVGVSMDDQAVSSVRGRSKREAIAELLRREVAAGADDAVIETVYGRFKASLAEAYRRGARAVEGAEAAIRVLAGREVAVVLATGLDRDTADLLTRTLAWESLPVVGVVTGDDVRRGRPAPDLVLAAMHLAGVEDPRAVATVGDSASDLDAGAAAAVRWNVGVLTGAHDRARLERHPHSAILGSVAELPSWLVSVGAL